MHGFLVIPAVDIRGGRCVRLYRGKPEEETVFYEDPVDAASRWDLEGADLIHVVDLDGAFEGRPRNMQVVRKIVSRVSARVEVGGGIRSSEAARRYMEAGVERVVIGTKAFTDPEWLGELAGELGEHLAVGVDAMNGIVVTHGWTETGAMEASELVERLASAGVARVIYTDVSRDGTMTGPDLKSIKRVAASAKIPLIASGGIRSVDDIKDLYAMRDIGVEGVIVGMALYQNRFSLRQAIDALGKAP